jgi:hypothetical protein
MESNSILTAISNIEQLVNIRWDAINDKFLAVSAQLDALNAKCNKFLVVSSRLDVVSSQHDAMDAMLDDKFQQMNNQVDGITNKFNHSN